MNKAKRQAIIAGNWKMNKTPAMIACLFALFIIISPKLKFSYNLKFGGRGNPSRLKFILIIYR